MPFKLIGMIILLVLVTIFCGFNNGEGYRCNVNLLFRTFNDVPVFLTVIASFAAGMVVTLPFTFGRRRKRGEKAEKTARAAGRPSSAGGAPEVKVTVRPGTIYDASPAQGAALAAKSAGAGGVAPAAGEKLTADAKSPFTAARENARAAKERRAAEKAAVKAEKQAKKQAGKKAAESPAPHSENDVPKVSL